MPLIAGSRLGPYEIGALLGVGGMGEVYRARDTRLGRDVAIKVMAPAFATDAARLARFELEARATATLNHPNIIAVFDVGVEGQPYVVSELLEGETLRTMLSRGALPPKTAVDFAIQMARGLAAAHDKAIVHRDLKPENVFVTKDGRVKILDFGLAKLIEQVEDESGMSSAATTHRSTMAGTVMGTVGYMAPEQVRAEPADHRADIFAFGAVAYEMLSGRRAFARGTAVETMTAVLNDEPPELTVPAGGVATVLDRIVRRCMEKQPQQRFQSASDIAFALEAISGSTAVSTDVAAVRAPATRRWIAAAVAAVAIAGVAGAFFVAGRLQSSGSAETPTFEARTFDRLPITNARFMPDGQTIVYSAASSGYTPELFVINPNTEGPQALGVRSAQLLSVSSKGELAIIVGARHSDQRLYIGTLARMTIGSAPRPMLEGVREADWSPDGGSLAITRDLGNGRDRLEYPVGAMLYEMTGYLSDLRVSPDGGRVAFFEHPWRFDDRGWVKVVDRAGHVTTLAGEFAGLQGLSWTRDGSTIVFSGNTASGYFMQPMAVAAAGGRPAQTVLGVPGRFIVYDAASDNRWLAVREDLSFGVRARVPGQPEERELSWLGSVGSEAMSGDGQWLLMVDSGPAAGPNYGVVLGKTDRSQMVRLGEGNPQKLSPDGKWAAAIVASTQTLVVYPTGAGEPVRIKGSIERYSSAEWFPDSKRLLVCGSEASHAPRCYEQDLSASPPKPVTAEGVVATLAPDGKTLLLIMPGRKFARSSIDGGAGTPIAALHADDRRIGWSRDSTSVFVHGLDAPATVERVDLASGQRTMVGRVSAEGVPSITQINIKAWIDDGRWYAYNYTTVPSTLFVVSGASAHLRKP